MQTYDINTSDVVVDGTEPGQTFRPLRYTQTTRDETRVGLWLQLSTILGRYRLDTTIGLDFEGLLDPSASDGERSAIVADVVLSWPGVIAITDGPVLTLSEDGSVGSISFTADTTDGPVSLTV